MRRFGRTLGARRADQAGNHAIDGDTVGGEIVSQRAGKANNARFCRHDMGAIFRAGMCAEAPDVDDGARIGLPQRRKAGFYTMEGAVEGDIHDFTPFGVAHLAECLFPPQRGIIDENIKTAELLYGRSHQHLHRGSVGDIADMDECLATTSLDLARDRFRLGTVAAHVDCDGRPAVRQRQRDRTPDIAARAGDDRDLAVDFPAARHDHYPRNALKSIRLWYSFANSFSVASLCASSQPPCRALSRNLSVTSRRVSGSCAPPRKYGWRSSITLPSFIVALIWPV